MGRCRDGCHDEGARHFAKPLLIGASADSVLCPRLVLMHLKLKNANDEFASGPVEPSPTLVVKLA